MNFERGQDLLKAMDIGIKIYRCGHCGTPTDENGVPLTGEEFKRVTSIIDEIGDSKTELLHGDCCIFPMNDPYYNRVQITREMAMDAQDPSLEGEWI